MAPPPVSVAVGKRAAPGQRKESRTLTTTLGSPPEPVTHTKDLKQQEQKVLGFVLCFVVHNDPSRSPGFVRGSQTRWMAGHPSRRHRGRAMLKPHPKPKHDGSRKPQGSRPPPRAGLGADGQAKRRRHQRAARATRSTRVNGTEQETAQGPRKSVS